MSPETKRPDRASGHEGEVKGIGATGAARRWVLFGSDRVSDDLIGCRRVVFVIAGEEFG
jgi:hypothetical protein